MSDEPAGPQPGPDAGGRKHARVAARLTGFVPAVSWVPGYKPAWFSRDAVAGFTIWGLLVPEMIAYASLAGLPPQAGLYTLLASPGPRPRPCWSTRPSQRFTPRTCPPTRAWPQASSS